MTDTQTPTAPGQQADAGDWPSRHRRRRLLVLVAAAVVVVMVGGVAYLQWAGPETLNWSHLVGDRQPAATGTRDNGAATATRTVQRRSLSQTTSVSGTLGYAGSHPVLSQAHGTLTWLPAVGQVIGQGRVLYRVDGKPVVLLYGSSPAYRALDDGATAGQDVRQLNHDLVALGYVTSSELDPHSDEFTWATRLGLERLQRALGVTGTGELALGDYVFLPAAARISAVTAKLGGPAGGQVLTATSTARQVTVDLDAAQQSQVKVGDSVTITLPDNRTTPGRVSSVGTVAATPPSSGSNGSDNTPPTITVHIAPTHPGATGTLDQAPVQVAITTATVHDVLVVPVAALLALSSGGYAVEVVDTRHHLVPVSLGLFDDADGLVQVSGSGLAAGQHVVVPAP